jgi:hypothetical protein
MRPWIWPGGELRVQRCTVHDLKIGDIAIWLGDKGLLSHRVVDLSVDGRFVTRGDLTLANDPSAEGHQLLGKAIAFTKGRVRYRLDHAWMGLAARAMAHVARRLAPSITAVRRKFGD